MGWYACVWWFAFKRTVHSEPVRIVRVLITAKEKKIRPAAKIKKNIERKSDGQHRRKISTVLAEGWSSRKGRYFLYLFYLWWTAAGPFHSSARSLTDNHSPSTPPLYLSRRTPDTHKPNSRSNVQSAAAWFIVCIPLPGVDLCSTQVCTLVPPCSSPRSLNPLKHGFLALILQRVALFV